MTTELPADKDTPINTLLNFGCCPLCALRLTGNNDNSLFNKSKEELRTYLELDAEFILPSDEAVCICCLGILQKYIEDDFITEISKTIISKGYEYHSYFCAISTPICILKREHSVYLAMKEKHPSYVKESEMWQVKDVWKSLCASRLSQHLGVEYQQESPFEISVTFSYEKNDEELSFLTELFPEIFTKRKNNRFGWELFTRTNVARALLIVLDTSFKKYSICPPTVPTSAVVCDKISCTYSSIYIAGRYNKYSRQFSQTPWFIEGDKIKSSVQEKICTIIQEQVKADDLKFQSSGREDVDVRMLGNGRPFAVEFVNPKKVTFSADDMKELQLKINENCPEVAVRDLQMITKDDTCHLKEGETEKTKSYSALCWIKDTISQETLDDKLNKIKDLVLQQKTPIRVLHRRPLAVRERTIHSMHAESLDEHHFKLSLKTQAGTYIKEFVHGDFLRTEPSLGTLLQSECDILALDVEEVELNWPKKIVYS